MGLGLWFGQSSGPVTLVPLNQAPTWFVAQFKGYNDPPYLLGVILTRYPTPSLAGCARFGQSPISYGQYQNNDKESEIRFDPLDGGFWAINNHDKTLVFTFWNEENPQSFVQPVPWSNYLFGNTGDQRWLFTPVPNPDPQADQTIRELLKAG